MPDGVWGRRHRGILTLLWLHVPGLFVFALAAGITVAHAAAEAGVVAGLGIAALAFARLRRVATILTALGLLTASAVLVHLSGGTIEAHFHFFVMVGIVVLYQDWWPFLMAIGFEVVHHGTVGVLAPDDVFNHPAAIADPWLWAAVHGGSIVAMSAASIVSWRLNEALRQSALRGDTAFPAHELAARSRSLGADACLDKVDVLTGIDGLVDEFVGLGA